MEPVPSPYLVPAQGEFRLAKMPTDDDGPKKKRCEKALAEAVEELADLQARLYAQDRWSLLLVFQAMDAAGKDSTIRAVMSGVNPAGCQVYAFKQPSAEELDHDFLWRSARRLPERGRIGIFNRSYYEEVLVVRVHPGYLDAQRLPERPRELKDLWEERYDSIREHERHLARNGTRILKFFLNVSRAEQRRRFVARIDEAAKNWKFSAKDVEEAERWDDYMEAYEDALRATSRPWAPWYCIPADDKPNMRMIVAELVRDALRDLDLKYPKLDADEHAKLAALRERLAKG